MDVFLQLMILHFVILSSLFFVANSSGEAYEAARMIIYGKYFFLQFVLSTKESDKKRAHTLLTQIWFVFCLLPDIVTCFNLQLRVEPTQPTLLSW